MADFPNAADIFAFAVFFVPGYLSLNIGSYLAKSKPLDIPWDEKIVVSYAWSLLIFLPVFTLLGLPLTSSNVTQSLSTLSALLLLAVTVLFGFVSAFVYYASLRFFDIIPGVVRNLGSKIGLESEEFYFDSAAVRFLKLMWEKRDRNEIIIETKSNKVFRGALGSKSFEPTMDIQLIRPTVDLPMLALNGKEWEELDEWSILVPEGNIRTVHAIRSRAIQE